MRSSSSWQIGEVNVGLRNLENCAVNVDYTPIVSYISPSVDAAAVYDYWITLEQSAKNLKNASELLEFMFMRNMEMNTVILQKDNVENMCFILVFFSEKASYDIKIKLLEMKDSVERFFESCRIHPFYGISGKHSSLKELHEAFPGNNL